MKKLFPIVIIAVMGALTFTTSCTKKSSSSTCTCKFKNPVSGVDTTFTITASPSTSVSLSTYCAEEDAVYKIIDATASCHM